MTLNDTPPAAPQPFRVTAAGEIVNPDPTGKWTEVEHLPQWDEEYYLVYTARKHGKWVMLKTLRPEFRSDPHYREMLEKEFDARYNLSHPNIVMINDLEDVPSVGLSIITDDVYGLSLRQLLDTDNLTEAQYNQLLTRLPAALEYIQQNHIAHHPLRPETIIFTENIGNLKLIDVGYDQKKRLSHRDTGDDLLNYGLVMAEVLRKTGRRDPLVQNVVRRCLATNPKARFNDVQALQLALGGKTSRSLYWSIIAFLALMVAILAFLLSHPSFRL